RMKVINNDSEVLYLLKINEDLFTYDTPLRMTFNEFSQLSGMDDDLFTYEVEIPKLYNTPRIEGQLDNLDNVDLEIYECKVCYVESGKIYVEAVILIDKRLTRGDEEVVLTEDELCDLEEELDDEPKEDNGDDIGDLDDYLLRNNAPFVIDEEEDLYKERRWKVLGIPYKILSMCNSEKFDVINYSLGPEEEYVAIKENEYSVWIKQKNTSLYGVSSNMDTAYRLLV
nr:hypothetical protein [Tanacetum cinerariifolium]